MDAAFLASLPPREMANGFAELIKHAILFDRGLFDELKAAGDELFRDLDRLASLVARSCGLKAAVVSRDEREQGERMLLNLGHTFGHAIEKVQDYRGLEHGEAVAVGTAAAAKLSVRLGLLDSASEAEIAALFRQFRLPVAVSGCDPERLLAAMASDKKAVSGVPRLVLPLAIGRAEVRTGVAPADLLAVWEAVCE
jgi:3-dehydroquinate synthase